MTTKDEMQEKIDGLLVVEGEMTEKIGHLHSDHVELQSVDYDADARVLRPYLDRWMDWHLWASFWLVQVKQARWEARQNLQEAMQKVLTNTRDADFSRAGLSYYASYEERRVYYEMRTRSRRSSVDILDRLAETTYDFILAIKATTAHWDKRRVDTKWELGRMSQLPGSDYEN